VVGGTERAGRDERGAVGDAVDTGGVEGFAQGQRRQDGGQTAQQLRAGAMYAQRQKIIERTPAWISTARD
jgi:hypothetical protein